MKKENKIFGILQKIGGAFMLPVAILPIAGLMLGIGTSITNETTLATYNLMWLFGQGTFLGIIAMLMKSTGDIVFANLPILFAVAVAVGMASKEKQVAGLAALVGYFVMHQTINALLNFNGLLVDGIMPVGALGTTLGIVSLQMGVFGGVLAGLIVAGLHNKFYKIELPNILSFFSGTRFVAIVTVPVMLLVGVVSFYLWQYVQQGITSIGTFVNTTGYFGTFIFGAIDRALIPFGLHHVFHTPFWQMEIGGTQLINGILVSGGQNIFFAQLADPTTQIFNTEATKYMMGYFPMMLFGLPGAALALYHTAKPQNKKKIAGLLLSATLTCILTGITEPLEFSFLFVAPLLYGVHVLFTGLAFVLMQFFQVAIGLSFSGSLIDFMLFGVLQGNDKTNWINVLLIGLILFPLYYFTFRLLIAKLNLKTPGRETENETVKLYTKDDYKNKDNQSALILDGLGGVHNIKEITCCATRLRLSVQDPKTVNEEKLQATGAHGVMKNGNGVQVIYGPTVINIKSKLEDYINEQKRQWKEKN